MTIPIVLDVEKNIVPSNTKKKFLDGKMKILKQKLRRYGSSIA